jgi:transposase InsO family protein
MASLRYSTPTKEASFTSSAFTGVLERAGVRISMDGRGRAMDNIFIERFWRNVKYEDVYLHGYSNPVELRAGLEATSRDVRVFMVPNVKVQVSDLLKGAGGGLEVPPRTLRRGEGKTQSGSAPVFAGGDLPLKILVPF